MKREETIYGSNPPCNQCGAIVSAIENHECKPSYKELVAEAGRQKRRADHTYRQVPALKQRIIDLEVEKDKYRAALENLLNEQNGPPLLRDEKTWQAAVDVAEKLIYGDKDAD